MISIRSAALGFVLGSTTCLPAALVLDVATVEVKPTPEQETVEVEFTFRNDGTEAVRIGEIDSSCACLSASLDKAVYQPGESGVGKAEFEVSSFVGRHEKVVIVSTDQVRQPEWRIPFVLDVPVVVEIEPRTLQWFVGDVADEKMTTVKMLGETPMKITKVTPTRENVTFEVETVEEGREYRIKVRPTTTEQVMLGALKIETDSEVPKHQRQLAYFSVFHKPSKQAQ